MSLGGPHLVDETRGMRCVNGQILSFDHHLHGSALADQARESLSSAHSGHDSEPDLGEPDLEVPSARDANVAREGELEAAADAVPVDRGNDELRRIFEAKQSLVRVEAEVVSEVRVGLTQHVNVLAGAEKLVAVPGYDDHVHV